MKIRTHREDDQQHVDRLIVYIGNDEYRMIETPEGRLRIMKVSDINRDAICVHPCSGNEIELS